jgi:hypothetical protein
MKIAFFFCEGQKNKRLMLIPHPQSATSHSNYQKNKESFAKELSAIRLRLCTRRQEMKQITPNRVAANS